MGDRETVHALSFAATTDPFHIDAAVNVTPVSRACPALAQRLPSLPCSSPSWTLHLRGGADHHKKRRGRKKKEKNWKQEEKRNNPERGRRNCAPSLLPLTHLDQPSYNTPTPPSTPFHPPPHSPSEETDGLLGSAREAGCSCCCVCARYCRCMLRGDGVCAFAIAAVATAAAEAGACG